MSQSKGGTRVSKTATNEDLNRLRKEVLSRAYASSTSLYVESARGAVIRDVEGREYIDFGVGIGVMNVGHSHPKVVRAIKDQAEKFTHTAFTVSPYEAAVRLAQHLCKATPGTFPKSVFFTNSGAEAVENAINDRIGWLKQDQPTAWLVLLFPRVWFY
jgi:4-aminobutyrate aminotransferase/(S)-3-amino-2-methylpropionate transaminase